MGIASWLLGLGMKTEETAGQMGVRMGTIPLQWPAGVAPDSLIHRLSRDPHKRASIFSKIQTIVVNEGETAVVLEDGVSKGALEPGRYVFEKARGVGSLDILWIKTGQRSIKWGVGNIVSSDGITVSGRGILYVRVVDGVTFNSQVVQGEITFAEVHLQRFLMPRIQSVMRTVMSALPAYALVAEREVFFKAITNNLDTTFGDMGLKIVDLEVMDVNLPPEYRAAIAKETMVGATQGARLLEAQIAAQEAQIAAQAAAQVKLSTGMADVQLLATLQAQGIDPLKLKALEAMQTMAENPAQGGMGMGDAARVGLIGQMAAAAMTPPAQPPHPQPQALPQIQEQPMIAQGAPQPASPQQAPPLQAPSQQAAPPPPAAPSGGEAARVAELEAKLEKLEDRLLDGEISEQMYEKLAGRIEARLAKLSP